MAISTRTSTSTLKENCSNEKKGDGNLSSARKFGIVYISVITIVLMILLFASLIGGSPGHFVLEWPPEQQEIVEGTLRMELTFEWGNESLDITAKINDDEYYGTDRLSLVFFRVNESGEVDFWHNYSPYIFVACNLTTVDSCVIIRHRDNRSWHLGQDEELGLVTDILHGTWPIRSPYHNCTFTEGIGYTFNISIPKSELVNVNADVVYVQFCSVVPFDKSQWGYDWVSRRVWGWR
jgi:hypothetical protein